MYKETLIVNNNGKPILFVPERAVAVTPHDTDTFQEGLLFVGVGGDVKAMPAGNTDFVTFKNVTSGSFLPIQVKAVHTDTTATNMLVCY